MVLMQEEPYILPRVFKARGTVSMDPQYVETSLAAMRAMVRLVHLGPMADNYETNLQRFIRATQTYSPVGEVLLHYISTLNEHWHSVTHDDMLRNIIEGHHAAHTPDKEMTTAQYEARVREIISLHMLTEAKNDLKQSQRQQVPIGERFRMWISNTENAIRAVLAFAAESQLSNEDYEWLYYVLDGTFQEVIALEKEAKAYKVTRGLNNLNLQRLRSQIDRAMDRQEEIKQAVDALQQSSFEPLKPSPLQREEMERSSSQPDPEFIPHVEQLKRELDTQAGSYAAAMEAGTTPPKGLKRVVLLHFT